MAVGRQRLDEVVEHIRAADSGCKPEIDAFDETIEEAAASLTEMAKLVRHDPGKLTQGQPGEIFGSSPVSGQAGICGIFVVQWHHSTPS